MFYFLSIPNGPAGLLVSVNEEPVHAIGILCFLSFTGITFCRKAELTHAHTHTHSFGELTVLLASHTNLVIQAHVLLIIVSHLHGILTFRHTANFVPQCV